MYLTRWYHRVGSNDDLDPKLGGDLGFVKYLAVPGDGDTLSVTLAVRTDDSELRAALSDADRFHRTCHMLPEPNQFFIGDADLEQICWVGPMPGLLHRPRGFAGLRNTVGYGKSAQERVARGGCPKTQKTKHPTK